MNLYSERLGFRPITLSEDMSRIKASLLINMSNPVRRSSHTPEYRIRGKLKGMTIPAEAFDNLGWEE